MRAWIEINRISCPGVISKVALFMRAWIEIIAVSPAVAKRCVALFMRAWIEISNISKSECAFKSRPLHEGVD